MVELQNIPELRFPVFTGDWVEKTLGAFCSKIGSGKTPRGGDKVYQSEGISFIRSQNVIDNRLILDETHISKKIHNEMKGSKVLPNDILLNITGASIGRSCVVPENFDEGNVNQHVSIIRLKNDNSNFLQLIISSRIGQKLIFQTQTGSGREGLNFQSIGGFKINFPTLPEQQKIAQFLTAIDNRINLLTKKKQKLEQYKKGIMQKIFTPPPTGGDAEGRGGKIRFKDDNGNDFPEWEVKKLGEVCNVKRGASPRPISSPKWFDENSKIGWVRISDVSKSNKFLNETQQYLSKEGVAKSRLIKKGNMIMSICATIGKPIYTNFDACIHDGFVVFANLKTDKEFLYYFLENIQKSWYRYGQPGTQVNLNSTIVSNELIQVPSLPEQKKIAQFLSSIDKMIAQVSTQIEKSKEFKKGLLQKMFV